MPPSNSPWLATVYLVGGGVALALAAGEAEFDTTAAVFAGVIALAFGTVVGLAVRAARNPRPLPAGARVQTGLITGGAVLGAVPAATTVFICTMPSSSSWLVAIACLLLGGVYLSAGLAAALERRAGVRVLRADNRFFLAH